VKIDGGNGNALPAIITADAADDLGLKERDTCIPFITALNTLPEKKWIYYGRFNRYALFDITLCL